MYMQHFMYNKSFKNYFAKFLTFLLDIHTRVYIMFLANVGKKSAISGANLIQR